VLPIKEFTLVDNYLKVVLNNEDIQHYEITVSPEEFMNMHNSRENQEYYNVAELVSSFAVHLGEKRKSAAILNELDLISNEYYKKSLANDHWNIDVVPIGSHKNFPDQMEGGIVSQFKLALENYTETQVVIEESEYFLYLPIELS